VKELAVVAIFVVGVIVGFFAAIELHRIDPPCRMNDPPCRVHDGP